MTRLRLTPAAFFLGLALICGSLVEYARWTYVYANIANDVDFDSDRARYLDIQFDSRWPDLDFNHERPTRWLEGAALVGVAGLVLILLKRRTTGAWILGLFTLVGLVPVSIRALEFSAFPGGRISHLHAWGLKLPPLLVDASAFVMIMAVLIAIAWLVAQRQDGVPLTPEAWIGVGLALAMIGIAFMYADAASHPLAREMMPFPRPPIPPERPTLWIAALALGGLLLSTRPLYVSRFVSLGVLLLGELMAIPAVAIVHDEQLSLRLQHEGWNDFSSRDIDAIRTTRCETPELQPSIKLDSIQLTILGEALDSSSDLLERRIGEVNRSFGDLHAQAGDLPVPKQVWQLNVARDTPLSSAHRVLRALRRAGVEQVTLTHTRVENVETWTQPMLHKHLCGLTIPLSDSGRPIAEFADWPSLVRAADEAADFQLDAL